MIRITETIERVSGPKAGETWEVSDEYTPLAAIGYLTAEVQDWESDRVSRVARTIALKIEKV